MVLHRARPRQIPIESDLVFACWWVVTRSMVFHCLTIAAILMIYGNSSDSAAPSYKLLLHWSPLWLWGTVLAAAALTWLLTRGLVCIVSGLVVTGWYFAFSSAFLASWVHNGSAGTTPTGWVTYGFLGWAWMCVTYVVWKDTEHVRREIEGRNDLDTS